MRTLNVVEIISGLSYRGLQCGVSSQLLEGQLDFLVISAELNSCLCPTCTTSLLTHALSRCRRVSLKWPIYLQIVGSEYFVMRFTYALHMRRQKPVSLSCLYVMHLELVIEIVFHDYSTPPCHKIDLFKRPFWGSHFEPAPGWYFLCCSLALSFFTRPPENPHFCQTTVWTLRCMMYSVRWSWLITMLWPSISKTIFIKRCWVEIMAFSFVFFHSFC